MTTQDYETLAPIVGNLFLALHERGGEELRTVAYDNFYTPLVEALKRDNERFDELKFSYAVASAEHDSAIPKIDR